jgi:hypothetical protein
VVGNEEEVEVAGHGARVEDEEFAGVGVLPGKARITRSVMGRSAGPIHASMMRGLNLLQRKFRTSLPMLLGRASMSPFRR